jgi:hypothetical protein
MKSVTKRIVTGATGLAIAQSLISHADAATIVHEAFFTGAVQTSSLSTSYSS